MKNSFNFDKVSKFVRTLYRLVSDDRFKEIEWTENGKGFRIKDKDEFIKNVMPYLSKTKEYSAFIRQLHHYGFVKIKTSSQTHEEYYHNSFQKDREDLLPYVKHNKDKTLSLYEDKSHFLESEVRYQEALEYINNRNHMLENEIITLKQRVDKQECTINGLVEILSRMFKSSLTDDNNLQFKGERNDLERLKLGQNAKSNFQLTGPLDLTNNDAGQKIFNLAKYNFLPGKFNKQELKSIQYEKKTENGVSKSVREDIFGDSEDFEERDYMDNFF